MTRLTHQEVEFIKAAHRSGELGTGDPFDAEARCFQLDESTPVGDDLANPVPVLLGAVCPRAYRLAKRVVKLYEKHFK